MVVFVLILRSNHDEISTEKEKTAIQNWHTCIINHKNACGISFVYLFYRIDMYLNSIVLFQYQ